MAVYQPFQIGRHMCIGMKLANQEMRLILARLLWSFDVTLTDENDRWDWGDQSTYIFWVSTSCPGIDYMVAKSKIGQEAVGGCTKACEQRTGTTVDVVDVRLYLNISPSVIASRITMTTKRAMAHSNVLVVSSSHCYLNRVQGITCSHQLCVDHVTQHQAICKPWGAHSSIVI